MSSFSIGPCRVGLIVTGRGEEQFLHHLFNRAFVPQANCLFSIVGRIPQLPAATSPRRLIRVTGTSRQAASWDEMIGLMAHGFLRQHPDSVVVLLDDMEYNRRLVVEQVFRRYRDALDEVLARSAICPRASVHFLTNMLEAYYLAHAEAVNGAASTVILPADHPADVEQIRDPKARLAALWPHKFREIEDGEKIVKRLDLSRILARPAECCWLRAMAAWCLDRFSERNIIYPGHDPDVFLVKSGCKAPLTYPQSNDAPAGGSNT